VSLLSFRSLNLLSRHRARSADLRSDSLYRPAMDSDDSDLTELADELFGPCKAAPPRRLPTVRPEATCWHSRTLRRPFATAMRLTDLFHELLGTIFDEVARQSATWYLYPLLFICRWLCPVVR
jgi:hypothetical protein